MLLSTGLLCLAMNIYHEARGEPTTGQIAVAQVTLNRAEQKEKPVCEVVLQRKQFSWTTGLVTYESGRPQLKERGLPRDPRAFAQAIMVAAVTMLEVAPNPVPESTHYHALSVSPYWAKHFDQVAVIGHHVFYR